MTGERFVGKRWQRALLSGIVLVPCLVPLVADAWRSLPAELRDVTGGTLGLSLGMMPYVAALEGIVLAALLWVFQAKMMTVVLTEGGLVLYRIWHLRWDEVRSARHQRFFGSEYLYVVRTGWLRSGFWVPLYFVGARPLAIALRDHAPAGSPIRECLDAALASGAVAMRHEPGR